MSIVNRSIYVHVVRQEWTSLTLLLTHRRSMLELFDSSHFSQLDKLVTIYTVGLVSNHVFGLAVFELHNSFFYVLTDEMILDVNVFTSYIFYFNPF